MKQFLYIVTLFFALFFSCIDGNVAYGQNMAREYNPNSPWNQTGEDGRYYMERCDKCGRWITGTDEDKLKKAEERHDDFYHREPSSGNDGNTSDPDNGSSGGTSGGSSDIQYSTEASLVHVSNVANAMASIGICTYNDFMTAYQWDEGLGSDGSARASSMANYINRKYHTKSNITLQTAINNGYKFIIFAKPYSGKYYDIYTNRNIGNINHLACDYIMIFDKDNDVTIYKVQ